MSKRDYLENVLHPQQRGFMRDELRPTELSYGYTEALAEDIADFYTASFAFHMHTAPAENRRQGTVREHVDTIDALERTINSIREAGCGALVNEVLRASVYMSEDFELSVPELPEEIKRNLELFDACALEDDLLVVDKRDFPEEYVMVIQKLLLLKDNGVVEPNEIMSQVAHVARDLFVARSQSLAEVIPRGSMTNEGYERVTAKPWADVATYVYDSFMGTMSEQIHAIDNLLHSAHMNGSILEHLTDHPDMALQILDAKDNVVSTIDDIAAKGSRAAKHLLSSLNKREIIGD